MLFVILVLILSIPAVQTRLGKYATKRINQDFKTDINIGRVGLQFNGDVELMDILIRDYRKDTLISMKELNTSIISFKNVINSKLNFGDIDIEELVFNLKTYEGEEDTNLDVFVAKFDDDTPRTGPSEFLFSSSDITIENGRFRLIDQNLKKPVILDFQELNSNITNFVISGPEVNTRINKLEFSTLRGVRVNNIMGDFEYALDHMTLDNLKIDTKASSLKGKLKFLYNREDFANFVNKVNIEASFQDSALQLDELNSFYNEFGANQKAIFSVDLSGTLNDLQTTDLNLQTTRNTKIQGDIRFTNLFGKADDSFVMQGQFKNLSSNYRELTALLPNVLGSSIPSIFSKVGNFRIDGNSTITGSSIIADLNINTDIGFAKSNLNIDKVDSIDEASFKGDILLEDFDLGKVIENDLLGIVSANLNVDGKGFKLETTTTNVEGELSYFEYNNYGYTNVLLYGDVGNYVFNGELIAKDPNIDLNFSGLADFSQEIRKFDFKANVANANLKELNFISNESISQFKGTVTMQVTGSDYEDLDGLISVVNTTYKNSNNSYVFQDFEIVSVFRGDQRTITINSPDIISGEMKGNFKLKEIAKLAENSLGSIYANYQPHEVTPDQHVEFRFNIYNQIAEIIDKDLEIGNNTNIYGVIETDEKGFELELSSPKISYKGYSASQLSFELDNSNPVYNTYIKADSLNTSGYLVSNFNLINVTRRDTMFVKAQFDGGLTNTDDYDLNLYYTIVEDNKSVVGFKNSNLNFKGYDWIINSDRNNKNKITFDRGFKEFLIDEIRLNQANEEVLLSGFVKDSAHKDLNLEFKNVELVKITPRLDSLDLNGRVNGKLQVAQNGGIYAPKSTVEIKNLDVNDYNLGDLRAFVQGDSSLTRYTVDVKLQNNSIRSIDANGYLEVGVVNPKIDIDVAFQNFLLDPLSPLGEGVISNIRGLVSGDVKVSGLLEKPQMNGELLLDRAGLAIPYLNIDYSFDFDSKVTLEGQQFNFNNVALTDSKFFSRGFLNGFIAHNNFSDWRLGLDLETDRLLVLNTQLSDELYYGTAFVSGSAKISGPTDQLVIDVEGSTAPGTVFNIPLKDSESIGDNSYIKFLSPEEKRDRINGVVVDPQEVKGLQLNFNLNVNQNALIEMVMDETSGSTIKGKGVGGLLFQINTNGTFKMWGDFSVFEGEYLFKYRGLVEKRFIVDRGSSIVWEGDPLDAQLNITAIYKTQANPSALLESPISRSIPVELGIDLTGELAKPDYNFQFDFPTVNSSIKSELDYRLSSKEDRDNQALFVLLTGGFASGENVNVAGTISERLNGIINGMIGDENGDFMVGLDLELGQDTPDFDAEDRLGITLQTNISDKVVINGKVGVPFGSANQTTITGDVQIDWLLNEDGSLRATVFNRENNIRNFGEEIGYTQGLGLSYNVEFDTFKELIQKIFKGKPKAENESENTNKELDSISNPSLPSFISMKKKESKKDQ